MIVKSGTVVKKSGNLTVKVEVNEYRTHPKYKKQFRVTKNFLAHDASDKLQEGDKVSIRQCAPISKKKTWMVIKDK